MKKYGIMLLALLACGAVYATQDATLTQREVRDPRQLEVILEANATDAESRLADIEAGTGIDEITVNNATVKTNITIGSVADAASYTADVGSGIDAQAAGALDIGNTTATSIDYGSSAVTAHTFTSDGTGDTEFVIPAGSISAAETVTAVQTSLGLADSAAQKVDVYGESTITGDAGAAAQLLMTNVIQTVAGDGSTPITDYAVIRAWVSETDMGSASTNNIEALTLSDGAAVETKTADADYIYLTGSAGEATVVIQGTASSLTNYLMISVGPQINSKAIVFVTP